MNERHAVAWLHRRAGFGLPPHELRAAAERGAAGELARLLDPTGAGASPDGDRWDNGALPLDPKDRPSRQYALGVWVETMVATDRPLVDRMAWLWHGHFVSALDKVKVARFMVDQVRLFRAAGLGGFGELLRAVTLDPAMLSYLDLRSSTGEQPNENYGRELLELFALGEGNYTEADVQAIARALTGWTVRPADGVVRFVSRRHDDSPQRALGVDGVHDLDTALAAVLAHPAMAPFVAGVIAGELLGLGDDATVAPLAEVFAADHDIRMLVDAALRAGLAGQTAPVVLGPLPWYVIARRVTGAAPPARDALRLLRSAGQLPMLPPNVAGWPGGRAWFSASSLVARANLAALIADATPDGEVLAAAAGDDADLLAEVLGLPSDGFADDSIAALAAAPAGRDRLAVALISPEFLIA